MTKYKLAQIEPTDKMVLTAREIKHVGIHKYVQELYTPVESKCRTVEIVDFSTVLSNYLKDNVSTIRTPPVSPPTTIEFEEYLTQNGYQIIRKVDTCLSKTTKSDNQTDLSIKDDNQEALIDLKDFYESPLEYYYQCKVAYHILKHYKDEILKALTMQEVVDVDELWLRYISSYGEEMTLNQRQKGWNDCLKHLTQNGYRIIKDVV